MHLLTTRNIASLKERNCCDYYNNANHIFRWFSSFFGRVEQSPLDLDAGCVTLTANFAIFITVLITQ